MKATLKSLKNRIDGEVLPVREHRSALLDEKALRDVKGGMPPAGGSSSCSPCEDDCVD